MKVCTICGKEKPFHEFSINRDKRMNPSSVSYRPACMPCTARQARLRKQEIKAGTKLTSGACPCGAFANYGECYRADRCAKDRFVCAAFSEWADTGTFVIAHRGAQTTMVAA